MVKLVYCLRRREGLSPSEFQQYWKQEHSSVVTAHAPALRIKRYTQVHPVATNLNSAIAHARGGPPAYDGVAELWWDSAEEFVEASGSPCGRIASEALIADERHFIDLTRSPLWLGVEHDINV